MRSAASAAPTAAGTAAAVNRNAREETRRKSIDLVRAGDEAAAGRQRLREGAHPQVDVAPRRRAARSRRRRGRRARRRRAPRRPSAARRAPGRARRCAGRSATSPSIEKTPSTTTSTPPPSSAGALEHLLELVEPAVAERAQLRAREQAAVEDRGVVARVGDHGVAGAEQRAERADVGLVARREDDRLLGAHPLRQLGLELEVQVDRAVEQPRAGEPGAVALERVARALRSTRGSPVSPR